MIQKSVFEKRINSPTQKQITKNQNIIYETKNSNFFKDISNSIQLPQNPHDYKTLYQLQQCANAELTQKIQLLQQKIRLLQEQNIQLKQRLDQYKQNEYNQPSLTYISSHKKSRKQLFFEQIRSFKENLPNSIKVIQFQELDNFQSLNFLTDQQIMSKNDVNNDKKQPQIIEQRKEIDQGSCQNQHKSFATSAVTLKIINDESLIDCLAMYGLSEQAKFDEDEQDLLFQSQLTYCSKPPHQIVKHSSKLLFPRKIKKSSVQFHVDEQAVQKAVSLISQKLKQQDMKAFTLIFEPANLPQNEDLDEQIDWQLRKEIEIINLINREKRFYAISIAFDDFDIVENCPSSHFPEMSFQNSLEQDIFRSDIQQIKNQEKHQKQILQMLKQNLSSKNSRLRTIVQKQENYTIRVSRKIITFFTKYPFIQFFQQLLIHCVKESFQSRKQQMKKNLSELRNFDHSKTIDFLKTFYKNLSQQYKLNQKFQSKLNQIFQLKLYSARLSRLQTLSLQLSKPLLKNFYSQIWAYPVLRLFTLDTFLQAFTLIMLQQKIIFVCQNQHILTSAIFLFTKVFVKTFNYPYPVVSIIPNQYDYFNAPFPIVYGCLDSKQNLVRQKIPKIYKNVYIVLSPNGVQIISHKNISKVQARKSPKLRDKLLPSFIKMENQQKEINQKKTNNSPRFSGLTSFLGLSSSISSNPTQSSTKNKFIFSNNNRQLSHQIIEKVFHYLNSIKEKLPSRDQVNEIKQTVQKQIKQQKFSKDHKNIDIDKQTYDRIKQKLQKKTSDPFVHKFLETQIVGMEILR